MEQKVDILYITYINVNEVGGSGSSVRPQKMKKAFEELGLNLKILSGQKNQIRKRHKNLKEILSWLDYNRPEICYIEPSSGPIYDLLDIILMQKLHRMNVPIGLFYRDAYWMFPEYASEGKKLKIKEKIKNFIIKRMSKRDIRIIKKTCDCVFMTSVTFSRYFSFKNMELLPPGCEIQNHVNYNDKIFIEKKKLTYIFVGGASKNHGTFLTLKSFEKANKNHIIAKLIFVCPEHQWKKVKNSVYKKDYDRWLKIYHTCGDKNLQDLYNKADIAILTAPNTEYRNFAVPVKIYEYISYNKPILVTDCYETEKVILDNEIGWSVHDNISDVSNKLIYLWKNQKEVYKKRLNCKQVCVDNSWINRAKKVVEVLSTIKTT